MSRSSWARALRTPLGVMTLILCTLLLVDIVVAPLVFEHSATAINPLAMLQDPSAHHWLGTDELGRDVLARTLVAARLSILLAVITTALATGVGIIVGGIPVVLGKRAGRLIVWLINLLIAFPGLLLALFLSVILGVGARPAILALAIATVPSIARLTYATASSVATADYVAAGRLLGVSRLNLIRRHIVPNIAEPLIVNSTTVVGWTLVSFSALSYLGFGVQPPSYDWGRMLSDGLNNVYTQPWSAIAPCVAIVLAGTTFILLGEVGATALDRPRARGRKPAKNAVNLKTPQPSWSAPVTSDERVLRVRNLSVEFAGAGVGYRPVADVSFDMRPGEILGIVGESGSGKSMMASAIADLLPAGGTVIADSLELAGNNLLELRRRERDRVLGSSLATVFQDPMAALNPAVRVGVQLAEVSTVHQRMSRGDAMTKAVGNLKAVRITSPERRAKQYPGEYSGGMRQRAMIGMGLMAEPALIIADEPTTALDVTVQREILSLLRQASITRGAAVLFISHDIAVISQIASRVLVMYGGRVVEDLPVTELVNGSHHPYTRALVASVPDMTTDRDRALETIDGRPPTPGAFPAGCPFAPRCAFADDQCRRTRPPLEPIAADRRLACWHPRGDLHESGASPLESGQGSAA
jgi:peptide/nickel transport system permease protein